MDKIRTLTDLGAQVKALRADSPLGVVEIAQKSGRSRTVLNRLERGQDVSLSSLMSILQVLGYTLQIVPSGRPTLQEMSRRFAQSDGNGDEDDGGRG